MTMKQKMLLSLLMLVVGASAMLAQDELEQTAEPTISCVIAWSDDVDPQPDSLLVTIENHAANPNADIYYQVNSYSNYQDPENQQWTLYTGPFLIGLWDMVNAFAIADGMNESDQVGFAIPMGYGYDFTCGKIHYAFNYYEPSTVLVTSIAGMYGMSSGYLESYSGDVVIPETVVKNGETYSVIGIESKAFEDQINLRSVTIPKTVQVIHENAFDGCTGLERVYITDIAAWCNIEYGYFPMSNPLFYARHLFMNGVEVKNLLIPDGVTEIKQWAFMETLSFTGIDIPGTVMVIGEGAFGGCVNLTSVICRALTPANGTNIFLFADGSGDVIYQQATLYVPNESLEAYRAHEEWGRFSRIVPFVGAGPGDVNGDGSIAISDVTNLIDQLLSGEEMPAYIDVNGDGAVTITDVTALIDMLLGGN